MTKCPTCGGPTKLICGTPSCVACYLAWLAAKPALGEPKPATKPFTGPLVKPLTG